MRTPESHQSIMAKCWTAGKCCKKYLKEKTGLKCLLEVPLSTKASLIHWSIIFPSITKANWSFLPVNWRHCATAERSLALVCRKPSLDQRYWNLDAKLTEESPKLPGSYLYKLSAPGLARLLPEFWRKGRVFLLLWKYITRARVFSVILILTKW